MTADFLVVLDACVLIQAPLRDTLLRLAEEPRLYVPRWSDEIIAETVRNLEGRIGLSGEKTAYPVIVTYNKRDFPAAATEAWGIEIQGPSTFLKHQYDLNPSVVIDKLHAQARNLGRKLPEQLAVLRNAVPSFVDAICQDLGIDLTA